jgi:hypothetical protein
MDILKLIKDHIQQISDGKESVGLNSVLTHIERAELLLEKGIEQQDEAYFTDVIYRTNQAFEGMLKESYFYLTGKEDKGNLTSYKIEQYLTDNKIFKERVLEQFSNYRQKWRNPSTHDHKLFFSHSESFLAIISVYAFIHLLINQIIEKLAFQSETAKLKKSKKDIKSEIRDYTKKDDLLKLSGILTKFAHDTPEIKDIKNEYELIGKIEAYIKAAENEFEVQTEPLLRKGEKIGLIPDFIIKTKSDSIIIEVKRAEDNRTVNSGLNQLTTYLSASGLTKGILFIPPRIDRHLVNLETKDIKINDAELNVVLITPGRKSAR